MKEKYEGLLLLGGHTVILPNKKISEPFVHVIRHNKQCVNNAHSVCLAFAGKIALKKSTDKNQNANLDRSESFFKKYKCTIFYFKKCLRCCRWIEISSKTKQR